jgi:hypothetical protein
MDVVNEGRLLAVMGWCGGGESIALMRPEKYCCSVMTGQADGGDDVPRGGGHLIRIGSVGSGCGLGLGLGLGMGRADCGCAGAGAARRAWVGRALGFF